jgi:hypothetical protein
MTVRPIGIILNGVTGRMGANQHPGRSITAIMKHGRSGEWGPGELGHLLTLSPDHRVARRSGAEGEERWRRTC